MYWKNNKKEQIYEPIIINKPLLGVAKPLLSVVAPLVKNPIVKMVADKTIGAVEHKMQKDKIIRAKEIEGATKIDIAHINAQKELNKRWTLRHHLS